MPKAQIWCNFMILGQFWVFVLKYWVFKEFSPVRKAEDILDLKMTTKAKITVRSMLN